MEEFEKELISKWNEAQNFNRIIQYVDMLKEPTYQHFGAKAAALNNLSRYYEALDLLEQTKEEGKLDPYWYYRYGYTLMNLNRLQPAKYALEKSVTLDDTFGDAWFLLANLYEMMQVDESLIHQTWETIRALNYKEPELLNHTDFLPNQQFDKDYVLFTQLDCAPEDREKFVHAYRVFIEALEQAVTTNDQLLLLTSALGQTIIAIVDANEELQNEDMLQQLVSEFIYITDWFRISEEFAIKLLELMSYCMWYEDDSDLVKPNDMALFLKYAMYDDHQSICDFYYALPDEERKLGYTEWVIQSHLFLNQFDVALSHLHAIESLCETKDMFHFWSGLAYVGLLQNEEAITQFKLALTHNQYHVNAWKELEKMYLTVYNDIQQANVIRERWEAIEENNKRYDDHPFNKRKEKDNDTNE